MRERKNAWKAGEKFTPQLLNAFSYVDVRMASVLLGSCSESPMRIALSVARFWMVLKSTLALGYDASMAKLVPHSSKSTVFPNGKINVCCDLGENIERVCRFVTKEWCFPYGKKKLEYFSQAFEIYRKKCFI